MSNNVITKPVFVIGLLITRTDGRTNERVSHLLNKSSSYVTCAKNQGISSSMLGGECE